MENRAVMGFFTVETRDGRTWETDAFAASFRETDHAAMGTFSSAGKLMSLDAKDIKAITPNPVVFPAACGCRIHQH